MTKKKPFKKLRVPPGHPSHPAVRDPEKMFEFSAAELAEKRALEKAQGDKKKADERLKYNQKLTKKKPAAKKKRRK